MSRPWLQFELSSLTALIVSLTTEHYPYSGLLLTVKIIREPWHHSVGTGEASIDKHCPRTYGSWRIKFHGSVICVILVNFWKPPYCGFPGTTLNTCNCDSFRILRQAKRSSAREVTEATEVPHAIEDQFPGSRTLQPALRLHQIHRTIDLFTPF